MSGMNMKFQDLYNRYLWRNLNNITSFQKLLAKENMFAFHEIVLSI